MKSDDDHLYVGPPSQEVDDAWIRLIYGVISILGWHKMPSNDDVPGLIEKYRAEFQSGCY